MGVLDFRRRQYFTVLGGSRTYMPCFRPYNNPIVSLNAAHEHAGGRLNILCFLCRHKAGTHVSVLSVVHCTFRVQCKHIKFTGVHGSIHHALHKTCLYQDCVRCSRICDQGCHVPRSFACNVELFGLAVVAVFRWPALPAQRYA